MADTVVIASAARTPIGKFNGSLAPLTAPQLGSRAIVEAMRRSGIKVTDVDEVIMGNVLTAGVGQNPARQAALGAGIPDSVPAFTVNKVCGSSLKAVILAAQAIKAGDASVMVAGGQESMTNAPYILPKARFGYRLGDGKVVDHMVYDGLTDVYSDQHMGNTGEIVAQRYDVSRHDADALAARSHERALKATENGNFKHEIVPIEIEGRDGTTIVERDEGIRPGTTAEALAKLRPVFKKDGLVTAGNASQISDGGSAVVVMSEEAAAKHGVTALGRIVGYDSSGVKPEWVMEAPIPSVRNLFKKTGSSIDEVDLFEHNEAFASASCAVRSQLKVPDEKFNVHGGAVALGHPIGASGARVLTTLLYGLKTYKKDRGVATLCLGGGNAVSMLVERV